jgi:hypothetical protein
MQPNLKALIKLKPTNLFLSLLAIAPAETNLKQL